MGDGIVILAFAGVLVSSASLIAWVRSKASEKKPRKTKVFDLND